MNIILDKESSTPLYRQIVRQIREMILSGILPHGFLLPPERRLATTLGVTRTTIINAYDQLKSEGLASAHVGRGTAVLSPKQPTAQLDASRAMAWSRLFRDEMLRGADPLIRDLLDLTTREGIISFAVGVPSRELIPVELFRTTLDALLAEARTDILHHSPTEGHPPLREALSHWLTARAIRCAPDEILVLSGSQQGLHLIAHLFLHPGDTVIVEEPTYFGALEAFRRAGARMIGIPIDEKGMRVDILEAVLERHRTKLIYTLPTFQNPSGIEMSLERRIRLLEIASSRGIPVLEEDPYSELRYDGAPLPSLRALDKSGVVLYLSTSSKILFPGLRIGWLVAPRLVVRQCALMKQSEDLHTNTPGQYALERMLREGQVDGHISHVRHIYREHRDAMQNALEEYSEKLVTWQMPKGGFYFWCTLPEYVQRTRLLAAAADKRIAFLPGHQCFVDDPGKLHIRLNFSAPSIPEIREGIHRFLLTVHESVGEKKPARERTLSLRPIV